ncbi:putative baseplate assembly protein [Thalassiella azotivora]
MTLPVVSLDDRRFQDIVDEAKRLIPRYCPDWTDHNVSDPGVALVELFAWMTEMVLYRLNQVPDRLYVKFLELVGVELFSSVPARTELLFRLTAPQDAAVRVPAGTQVGTRRADDEPVVFLTEHDAEAVPPRLSACLVSRGQQLEDRWDDLSREAGTVVLFESLQPDEAFYVGFAEPLAGCLVRLDLRTGPEGAGVDPTRPPRVWEAWDGGAWQTAEVLSDTSAGFNTTGQVEVLLPQRHALLALGPARAHWLRCRLVTPAADQPPYRRPPVLEALSAATLGVAVPAQHGEPAPAELLGTSTGRPGQVFQLRRHPVLPRRPGETVRVVAPSRPGRTEPGAQDWAEVADFADVGPDERVVTVNGATGEVRFGPRVLDRHGTAHQHGAVPEPDAQVWVTGYRYGGGRRGNVAAGQLEELRTTVPFVAGVTNRHAATGGVDAETVENARVRGPMTLRGGGRAVTRRDVERLALDAVRGVARARCLDPERDGGPARLLVVPRVDVLPERLQLDDLAVPDDLVERIRQTLEPRRVLTVRVQVGTPRYQGITVVADVRGAPGIRPETVRESAEQALYAMLDPLRGGSDGTGWPFDEELTIYDAHAVLRSVPGVLDVRTVRFFTVDLRHPDRRSQVDQRVPLPPEALFLSYRHRVVVTS